MILGNARGESQPRLPKSRRFVALRKSFLLVDRPAAVRLDTFIDLAHQLDGGGQRGQDLEIMGNILCAQLPPAPVLQPFCADLVAANLEVPDLFRHLLEGFGRVDHDAVVGPFGIAGRDGL